MPYHKGRYGGGATCPIIRDGMKRIRSISSCNKGRLLLLGSLVQREPAAVWQTEGLSVRLPDAPLGAGERAVICSSLQKTFRKIQKFSEKMFERGKTGL